MPFWVCREMVVLPWAVQVCKQSKFNLTRRAIGGMGVPASIELDNQSKIQNIPDEAGSRPCRFTVSLDDTKLVQFSAPDHR